MNIQLIGIAASGMAFGLACARTASQPPPPPAATTRVADGSQNENKTRYEEELKTIAALVTQLQKDMQDKQSQYEKLSRDPVATDKQRQDAKRAFLESQEQLLLMKERLNVKRSEQREREVRAEQLQKLKEKLAKLHEEETKLSESARASKKKYQDLELTKGVDPLVVEKVFRDYIEIGGRLSALRQRIMRAQADFIALDVVYQEDSEASQTSDREIEEKFLTLMALVTELQVDMLGEEAQYEAILKTQPVKKSVLRQARANYMESVEQFWAIKEQLVIAREDQARCDRRHAERLKREEAAGNASQKPPTTDR